LKDILLITPPFTQLNTPYPATAYLKGFLNTKGIASYQMDLGIEVMLALFCKSSFEYMFDFAFENDTIVSENCERIYALRAVYLNPLDAVVEFLQGKNHTFARQICTPNFLPQSARFEQLDDMDWAFGTMGMQDKAKHLATLYLEDLSDFVVECIDENFGFSRYAERLGQSANSFDELYKLLGYDLTYIDAITLFKLKDQLQKTNPDMVCFSVPFPGNLYSAFRCAKFIKKEYPHIKIVMGGGFPNTELRSLTDVRVFEFFDFITLDDGELPIELLISHVLQGGDKLLKRTFLLENNTVFYNNLSEKSDYKQRDVGCPDYADLLLDSYISVIEIANPMHSLWSDGRWNKLTMAHGCYWAKCTFCDVSLDYVKLHDPITASLLVDRMEQIIGQTGDTGFHFVDEAAPPALMRALCIEILKRKLTVTWWANIRFEKNFTQDLCFLLKKAGCIAVSGGLEVASDRLLKLIDKGVSVAQVAQVTRNFTKADIMVHSYLMYGFPTQTVKETVDSLEMVRQLFEAGIVQSGFWHQFALTAHSPIGKNPEDYGVRPLLKKISFADNDVDFIDKTGLDHSKFSFGLKKSLYNYMHGIGFDLSLQEWFDFKIPKTNIASNFIENSLETVPSFKVKNTAKVLWLGSFPFVEEKTKKKRGQTRTNLILTFHDTTKTFSIILEKEVGDWFLEQLPQLTVHGDKQSTFGSLKADFEEEFEDFELFWFSKPMQVLQENGLLLL